MMTNCRIGKIKWKDRKLVSVPVNHDSVHTVKVGWGEITFRCYDGEQITNETIIYMLRAVEDIILRGDDE